MFHMLSCFNAADGVTEQDLRVALSDFFAVMRSEGLVRSVSPLGRRDSDTEMDTDEERPHQYFYTMSFSDKAECDKAYAFIENPTPLAQVAHTAVVRRIKDNIHICWEDVPTLN